MFNGVMALSWTGEVTVKVAIDLNGGVDDLIGKAERFTSAVSLDAVHRLRRHCDAVLVGVGTVIRDDPSLTVRRVECTDQPLRVVIDPNNRAPPNSKLFTDGFNTVHFGSSQEPWINLHSALATLEAKYDVKHLMIEGGPCTIGEFFHHKLVDRAIIIRAPLEFSQPVPSGIDIHLLQDAGLTFHSSRLWDTDTITYWTKQQHDYSIWNTLEEEKVKIQQ